ncbi:hypothetical protein O181_129522 [Austropuccinia psidii MF-1]|uniref:Uncharacterized protein n=1 Tax=Austropuccinia psidii MF-1 TaxID=1389203 RepID=A0A9Q3QBJ5_9BASI|nr:hypothetical protein [Austropuccinia psidii MF-1]
MFAENPAEDNKTTVKGLGKENCPSSPTPVVNKKKKGKKLAFPGPIIKDSEEEPNSPFNQMELDSEVDLIPQKGKEREKYPVEQNPHKEVPYTKGKSKKCP